MEVGMIPVVAAATMEVLNVSQDVKLIREMGRVSRTQMSRELGISRMTVYRYEMGDTLPAEPIVLRAIQIWAQRLRHGN